jgi:hypothetical protein
MIYAHVFEGGVGVIVGYDYDSPYSSWNERTQEGVYH